MSALEATEELGTVLEGVKSFDVVKKPVGNADFLKKVRENIMSDKITIIPFAIG